MCNKCSNSSDLFSSCPRRLRTKRTYFIPRKPTKKKRKEKSKRRTPLSVMEELKLESFEALEFDEELREELEQERKRREENKRIRTHVEKLDAETFNDPLGGFLLESEEKEKRSNKDKEVRFPDIFKPLDTKESSALFAEEGVSTAHYYRNIIEQAPCMQLIPLHRMMISCD